MTPAWKRYQLDTCYLLNSNEHAFIYPVLIKNDMHIYYILRDYLANNLFSYEMDLKWPLSRDSQFKLHFHLRWRENRGSRQSFHVTSFSKDCWLIISKHEAFNKNKVHGNADLIKETTWQNHELKIRMPRVYLVNRLYLQK